MIRLRARVFALCMLGLLPLSSPAATIKVTTPFDIVLDDDELCSIREAVTASQIASNLSKRTSAKNSLVSVHEALDKALLDIAEDNVNIVYSRNEMLIQMDTLKAAIAEEAFDSGTEKWIKRWQDDSGGNIAAEMAVFQTKVEAMGVSRGAFDFSQSTSPSYPAVPNSYVTYRGSDDTDPSEPVTIVDSRNLPAGAINYVEGDRAIWNGASWSRLAPADELPAGAHFNGDYDFSRTGAPAYPEVAEPGYYTYVDSAAPFAASASITDSKNLNSSGAPVASLSYSVGLVTDTDPLGELGDRAYWDGTNWRRFGPKDTLTNFIPKGLDSTKVEEAIAYVERIEAFVDSEIERLEGLALKDGCDDGSSFDVIVLEGDTTYKLNSPLVMNIRLTVRGGGATTVIEPCRVGDTCGGVAVVAPHRLITVPPGISTEIVNMTLRNGNADTFNGGAISTESPLTLSNVRIENNIAAAGGGIQVETTGSLELDNVQFTGNFASSGNGGAINQLGVSMRLTKVIMGGFIPGALDCAAAPAGLGNRATGNGGAIALQPENSTALSVVGGAFVGNCAANGSAIYFQGNGAVISMENVTLAKNRASGAGTFNAVMNPDPAFSPTGGFTFNNLTIIENVGVLGTGGIVVNRLMPVQIYNSVLAGNQDLRGAAGRPDCDFAGGVLDTEQFRRNYYSNPVGADCPGARYPSSTPESENFELGTFSLIDNPLSAADNPLLKSMDPDLGLFYVPFFPNDVNDSSENRLVNRGAGSQDVGRCTPEDQRDFERSSSVDEECDIGAVEYQIGRRHDDDVEILVDERRCISVIGDDLGDAFYVPGTLRVFDVERATYGYSATVISANPAAWAAQLAALGATLPANVDTTLDFDGNDANGDGDLTDAGDTPAACPNLVDLVDTDGKPVIDAVTGQARYREVILVEPSPGFRGQTNILYGLDWRTGGTSPVGGSVTAIARVVTESRGGISSSTLGAISPFVSLMLAGLLVLRRLRSRFVTVCLFSLLATTASAEENIIYVNSSLDEPVVTTPSDGACTLREALETARNDRANMTGGDCFDGNEGPDVIEFATGTTEVVLEDTVIAHGSVTVRCPAPPEPVAGGPAVVPQVCKIHRRATEPGGAPNPKQFRLIDSRGSLLVSRVIFEDGQAPDRGAGQEGGAIYTTGSLTVVDSVFRNNSAVSGGAIFLAGTGSALNIARVVFEGNSSRAGTEFAAGTGAVVGMVPSRQALCPSLARGGLVGQPLQLVGSRLAGGGAIATTQSDSHKISIQASSFIRNCSVVGAAAVDLNSRASVVVANSTFSGNVSFEGPGAIDVSGAQANAILRNITVLENQSGRARVHELWEDPLAPLPQQRRALQFGVVNVFLTSSIISGNVTEADTTQAANCAPLSTNLGVVFNVFGDEDDDALAGISTPGAGHTCRILSTDHNTLHYADNVYNAASPASGMLSVLSPVDVNHMTLWMYVINNPVTSAGVLVDAGYDRDGASAADNQVDPVLSSTLKCANTDARGVTRESGGKCDIGAFEVLGVTARDDLESNNGRGSRLVAANLIANDIFDDFGDVSTLSGRAIKQDCTVTQPVVIDPVSGDRITRFVGGTNVNGGAPDICIEVTVPKAEYGDPGDPSAVPPIPAVPALGGAGEVLFCYAGMDIVAEPRCEATLPTTGYVILYDNHGVIRDENHVGSIQLTYRAYTVGDALAGQLVSLPAKVNLTIDNVPPSAVSDTVVVGVGESATVNVLANDSDPDADLLALPPRPGPKLVQVTGSGCVAKYELDQITVSFWQCQFGKVTMDANAGTITWKPDNAFNPFSQDVMYEINDQDPVAPKVSRATLRFLVDRPVANGGSILGNDDISDLLGLDFLGAPGVPFFIVLLLGGFARRRS